MNYRELIDRVAQRIGDPKAQTARVSFRAGLGADADSRLLAHG